MAAYLLLTDSHTSIPLEFVATFGVHSLTALALTLATIE